MSHSGLKSLSAAAALSFAAAVGPAAAAGSYIGKWASTPGQCALPQENPRAPLILDELTYDQHEAHCKFYRVYNGAKGLVINARCTIEGDKRLRTFLMDVAGDRLTIRSKRTKPITLLRCPG